MPKLEIMTGNHARQQFDIRTPQVWIGSDESCLVSLREPGISRYHAQLSMDQDGRFWLQDAGGSFGTLLNGRDIDREQLFEGDEITLGRVKIVFHEEGAPYGSGITHIPTSPSASHNAYPVQLPAPAPHPPHPPGSLPPALRDATSPLPPPPPLGTLFPPEPLEYGQNPTNPIPQETHPSVDEDSLAMETVALYEQYNASQEEIPLDTRIGPLVAPLVENPLDLLQAETTSPSLTNGLNVQEQVSTYDPISAQLEEHTFEEDLAQEGIPTVLTAPPTEPPAPYVSSTGTASLGTLPPILEREMGLSFASPSFTAPQATGAYAQPDSHAFLDALPFAAAPSLEDLDRDLDAAMSTWPPPTSSSSTTFSTKPKILEQALNNMGSSAEDQMGIYDIILPIQEESIPHEDLPHTATTSEPHQEAEEIWQAEQAALGLLPTISPFEESSSHTPPPSIRGLPRPPLVGQAKEPQTPPLSLDETIAHILSHASPSRHEHSLSFQTTDVWKNEADQLRALLRQREEESARLYEQLQKQEQQHRELMNKTLQLYREENERLQRQITIYDQARLEKAQLLQWLQTLEVEKQQTLEQAQQLLLEQQRLQQENQELRSLLNKSQQPLPSKGAHELSTPTQTKKK